MKKGIVAASIICLMISGCGKKNDVSDDFSNIQGDTVTSETSVGTDDVTTEEAGQETLQVNYTKKGATPAAELDVNAVVDTRVPEHVTTMKVKKHKVDDEFLKKLAHDIFDRGEYEVLPSTGCKVDELNSTIADMKMSLDSKAHEYGGAFEPSDYYWRLKSLEASLDMGESVDDSVEGMIKGEHFYEDDGVEGDYEICYIKGMIDNKPYILEYELCDYSPNDKGYFDRECIQIIPMDGQQIRGSYINLNDGDKLYAENEVDYNSALALAEDCISQLGFDDYALTETFHALCDKDASGVIDPFDSMKEDSGVQMNSLETTQNLGKNGYRFIFTPGIDGLQVAYLDTAGRSTLEYDAEAMLAKAWKQPVIQIDIDVTGVRDIKINGIYDFEEALTDNSNLISFSQADKAAQDAFEADYEEYANVNDIQLKYVIAEYDDESVMIPAWVYYRGGMAGEHQGLFAVNALDGSIIHMSYDWTSFAWIK